MFLQRIARRNTAGGQAMRFAAALMTATAITTVAAAPAYAQESTASLRGRVTANGTAAASQVVAIEVNTGFRRTSSVSAEGRYNLASLPPGTYRLQITTSTGVRNTDEFTLIVGQDAELDFDFSAPPEAADAVAGGDSIIVTGARLKTMEGGEVGTNITQRLIEQLPQNNRNFLAFADLAPGVQYIEGATSGQSRIQGGAQDSRTVNVFIDGVSQKDYVLKNGVTGQDSSEGNPFPQLGVGEYRVISSNYKAEFDQVSSVAITAVTKSGTNEFHGEGFIDFTNEDLRARFPSELGRGELTPTRNLQFGGALGGAIIRDLMHFFVTYEGKRIQRPLDFEPGGGRTVDSLPAEFRDLFGVGNTDFTENLYFGKLNFTPTGKDLFELSGKYRDETGVSGGGGTGLASTQTLTEVDELRALGRWQHTEDNWINDLRISYEDVSWSPQPAVFEPQFVLRASEANAQGVRSSFELFRFGGGLNFQDKGQKGWTVQDDFTYTGFEGHTIKAGVKGKWVKLNSLQQNFFNPRYTFDLNLLSDTGFNTSVPYRVEFGFESGPTQSTVVSENFQFGVYIQDDWDVTDRLTLNLGLRWDYEETPAYLDFVTPADAVAAVTGPGYPNLQNANYDINDFISDGNDRKPFLGAFQPRIGFSYELDRDARFILFGGFGRSYDRNQFDFLQQEISIGSFSTRTFNFIGNNSIANQNCTPSPTCVPFNPIYLTPEGLAMLANSTPGGGRGLRFITNDLKIPYSDQLSLGLRTRWPGFDVEVGYTHIESKDGFAYLLGNRRPDGSFFFDNPNSATDTPSSPFTFTPPGFGSITIGTNGLETRSDSLYLKLNKRYTPASPWSLDATYTYTDAVENRFFGEFFSFDFESVDDFPFRRSAGVPRHRIVAAGSVDTPVGVTLSAKFTYQSPITLVGFINSAQPFFRDTYAVEAEPNGDRWGLRQLDFAATKYFNLPFLSDDARIRFRIDVLNVMNDRNYNGFNNNRNDSTRTPQSPTIFGERTGLGVATRPRTIKLSAGFSF